MGSDGFSDAPVYPGSGVVGGVDCWDVGGGGLERGEELIWENTESFGNLEEIVNEELLATGLDVDDRGSAEIGGLGKLLLRQPAGPNLSYSSAQRFVKGLLGWIPQAPLTL